MQQLSRRARPTAKAAGANRNYRLWIILGIIAFVFIMAIQLIGGGGSGSSTADTSQSTAQASATETSDYLAGGYSALDGSDKKTSSSMFGIWGGILIPLAIVIALIYAALKGLKYVNGRVAKVSSNARVLESLDVLPLSQNGSIHLVRVGQRVLAVGASSQQLSVLADLDGEQAEGIVQACRAKEQAGSPVAAGLVEPFRELVQKRLHRSTPDTSTPPAPGDQALVTQDEPLVVAPKPEVPSDIMAALEVTTGPLPQLAGQPQDEPGDPLARLQEMLGRLSRESDPEGYLAALPRQQRDWLVAGLTGSFQTINPARSQRRPPATA